MNALDLSDATYNLAQIGIFSAIVPLLGIINANLPVITPAMKKLFNSTIMDTKHPSGDTSGDSLQLRDWDRRGGPHSRVRGGEFKRLDEPERPLVH